MSVQITPNKRGSITQDVASLMDTLFVDALNFLQAILTQGGLYAIVALGLVITFQVIRFPDLTPDGSFTLGAAFAAHIICITPTQYAPYAGLLGTLCAFLSGWIAGSLTALLSIRMKISRILSGILVMTMLYTISLRIMGRGNISLIKRAILGPLESNILGGFAPGLFLFVTAIVSNMLIWFILRSDTGLLLRATGQNALLVKGAAKDPERYTLLGVALSNGLVALGGALSAQQYGFADINLGLGTLVSGLACLFLGGALVQPRSPRRLLLAAFIGSFAYVLVRNIALRLGLDATDLKLVTAIIIISVLALRIKGGRYALPVDPF